MRKTWVFLTKTQRNSNNNKSGYLDVPKLFCCNINMQHTTNWAFFVASAFFCNDVLFFEIENKSVEWTHELDWPT